MRARAPAAGPARQVNTDAAATKNGVKIMTLTRTTLTALLTLALALTAAAQDPKQALNEQLY